MGEDGRRSLRREDLGAAVLLATCAHAAPMCYCAGGGGVREGTDEAKQPQRRTHGGAVHHLNRAGKHGDACIRGAPPGCVRRGWTFTKIPVSSPQLANQALEAHVTRSLLGG